MAGEPRKRLGELLLEAGVIDAAQLQAALGHQRQWGARLGQALVDLKLASEADIVQALSRKYGYEVARLDGLQAYALEQALRLVPRDFAVRHNVLPMAADPGSITVAMSDPTNLAVVDELRFRTGRRVKLCVGGDREIAAAVRRQYPTEGGGLEAIALDLEADEAPGEPVLDPFGGGSKDALEAFFGSGPAARPSAGAGGGARPGPAGPPRLPIPGAPVGPVAGQRAAAPARPPPAPPPASAQAVPEAPAAAGPGATLPWPPRPDRPGAPAPGSCPAPGLELEDAHAGPEAMEHARAAFLGAIPPGGLAEADDPLHARMRPSPAAPAAPGQPAAAAPLPPDAKAPPQFTARERAVLDALERLAGGAHAEPELLKPAQAMAAVIRILIRRGIVTEREFLDELRRR